MQLDLSKAYDKICWQYMDAVLESFGFGFSPFLFIVMMEGLGRAITVANREETIIRMKMHDNIQ